GLKLCTRYHNCYFGLWGFIGEILFQFAIVISEAFVHVGGPFEPNCGINLLVSWSYFCLLLA
ncbi:hypothetical protein MKW94_012108, partial [Papaver nudicaule]|nr:hypothetical protein [Papaver nudicaule]